MGLMNDRQAFSLMGVHVSCEWPLSKKNWFIFHMLPYKLLFVLSRSYSTYWKVTFCLKACQLLSVLFKFQLFH